MSANNVPLDNKDTYDSFIPRLKQQLEATKNGQNILQEIPGLGSTLSTKQIEMILHDALRNAEKHKTTILGLKPGKNSKFKRNKAENQDMRTYYITKTYTGEFMLTVKIGAKFSDKFKNVKRLVSWFAGSFKTMKPLVCLDAPKMIAECISYVKYDNSILDDAYNEIKVASDLTAIGKKEQKDYFAMPLSFNVNHNYVSTKKEKLNKAQVTIQMPLYPKTLKQALRDPKCSTADRLRYMQQLIDAISIMHKQNIEHRDLKLDNVFVDAQGNIKVGDFGLAVKFGDYVTPAGSPLYMPPWLLLFKFIKRETIGRYWRVINDNNNMSDNQKDSVRNEFKTHITSIINDPKNYYSDTQKQILDSISKLDTTKIDDLLNVIHIPEINGSHDIYSLSHMLEEIWTNKAEISEIIKLMRQPTPELTPNIKELETKFKNFYDDKIKNISRPPDNKPTNISVQQLVSYIDKIIKSQKISHTENIGNDFQNHLKQQIGEKYALEITPASIGCCNISFSLGSRVLPAILTTNLPRSVIYCPQ